MIGITKGGFTLTQSIADSFSAAAAALYAYGANPIEPPSLGTGITYYVDSVSGSDTHAGS